MTPLLLGIMIVLVVYNLAFAVYMAIDCFKHRNDFRKKRKVVTFCAIGFVCFFLDTFGIGNFATVFIAKMDIYYLMWIVIAIMYYTIVMYIVDVIKDMKQE
ncbi:MAG: hypothetical protein HUJ63_06310 [Enterococcus sp.]|nr:hypothetical protein [Enterococcus sp.]